MDSRNLIVRIKKDSQEDNWLINNAIDNNSVNLFAGADTSLDKNDDEKKDKYNNLPKKTKKVASIDVNKSKNVKKDSIQDYDSLTKGLS